MKRSYLLLLLIPLIVSCVHAGQWSACRGMASYKKQKYKKAAHRLETASNKGYTIPGMHFALGSSYLYLGRYNEATKELEIAASESVEEWFVLGNTYNNMGNFTKAAEAYRKAISLKPDYLDAIEALAMLYSEGVVKREEALALWKRALELDKREEWIARAKHYIEQLEQAP